MFFHCSPSGHGDLIRVYTRFGSKITIHHLKLGVIFGCFLVMLIPCVPAHEISPVFVFRLELGGGKNEITMARTAKKDKKMKFHVFCTFCASRATGGNALTPATVGSKSVLFRICNFQLAVPW